MPPIVADVDMSDRLQLLNFQDLTPTVPCKVEDPNDGPCIAQPLQGSAADIYKQVRSHVSQFEYLCVPPGELRVWQTCQYGPSTASNEMNFIIRQIAHETDCVNVDGEAARDDDASRTIRFDLTAPKASDLPALRDRLRWSEKLLAERWVALIRKGQEGLHSLLPMNQCLMSKLNLVSGRDGVQNEDFFKEVQCVVNAFCTLCDGGSNAEAVANLQKHAGHSSMASLCSIINAALTTSRHWQDSCWGGTESSILRCNFKGFSFQSAIGACCFALILHILDHRAMVTDILECCAVMNANRSQKNASQSVLIHLLGDHYSQFSGKSNHLQKIIKMKVVMLRCGVTKVSSKQRPALYLYDVTCLFFLSLSLSIYIYIKEHYPCCLIPPTFASQSLGHKVTWVI